MDNDLLKQGIRTALLEALGAPKEGSDLEPSDIEAATDSVFHFLEHQYELKELHPVTGPVRLKAYFDGNGNKEHTHSMAQWMFIDEAGHKTASHRRYTGLTNNELEYNALIHLMDEALNMVPGKLEIFGDSKLVIEQVHRRWRVKEKHLIPLRDRAEELLGDLRKSGWEVSITWCSSKENLVDAHA